MLIRPDQSLCVPSLAAVEGWDDVGSAFVWIGGQGASTACLGHPNIHQAFRPNTRQDCELRQCVLVHYEDRVCRIDMINGLPPEVTLEACQRKGAPLAKS